MSNEFLELIEKKLDEYLPVERPEEIFESMRYSTLAGGKRLRPILCLETCRIFGGNIEDALPTACAIEMLHTQSLIHDDLPCMDNDDYRRGKLTNHKKFSESTAVLAGDALLSFAPQLIIRETKNVKPEILLKVLDEFFTAAGAYGIIAGQVVDIACEGKICDKETLEFIHTHKTMDLFKLALRAGAILANANEEQLKIIDKFAFNLGFAFQICDDILDETSSFEEMGKTLGKDKVVGKLTYTSLYGLEESKCKVVCLLDEACVILEQENIKSELFGEIIDSIKGKALGK